MSSLSRVVAFCAIALASLSVAACGSGGSSGGGESITAGSGSISITSFSPNPVLGCAPTPFVITGTNFQTVTGTTAIIKFTAALGGPFGGSNVATVIGSVVNNTTITGTTPEITLCGIAAVSVTVDVTLESGVSTSSTGTGITISISAPTLISVTPNPIPAAIPTALTITGTGFGPAGGAATVRFVSANLGDINFVDGTANSVDVAATVTGPGTITLESPLARACTANFTSSVQVILSDGCCTAPTAATFLTWLAPTLTALAYGSLSAVIPTTIGVQGTNLGVDGEIGTVRLTQSSTTAIGLLFNNFGSQTIDLPAVVAAGGTLAIVTIPPVSVCASPGVILPTISAFMRWIAPRGSSCADHPSGATATTFLVPPITSITTPTVPALVATPFTMGFGFAVANGVTPIRLVFTSTSAGTPPIFADGTSTTFDVVGNFNTPFSVAGTTPIATLCGVDTATASVTAYFAGGSCVTSAPNLITYQAPALATASPGGIQNPSLPLASFPNNNMFSLAGKEAFVLNALPGRSFGTPGAFVEVRFSGGGNIWQGGAQSFDTVVGQVTSATTIAGATPATVSTSLTILAVTVQALFEDGSCSGTTAAQFTQTSQRTFAAGTGGFFTINQNGAGAPALIGAAVAAGTPGGLAVDGRKNRLFSTYTNVYDTAQTMLGTPVVPTQFAVAAGGGAPADVAAAPDFGLAWATSTGGPSIANVIIYSELTGAASPFLTTPLVPARILYNAPAGEMVIASPATAQIALYSVATQSIDALFAVPPIANGVVTPLGTATWNGVMALRPGASGTARAYMVYNDANVLNVDNLATLSFSTGAITPFTTAVNQVSATNPNSLTYDAFRDELLRAYNDPVPNQMRIDCRNAVTLGIVISLGLSSPGNPVSISDDPVDDRYYLSDTTGGQLISINRPALSSATVLIAAAGNNVSTSP